MSKKSLGTLLRAKGTVASYYTPKPNESKFETFKRAKAEATLNLLSHLQDVEQLTEEEFFTFSQQEIDDAN